MSPRYRRPQAIALLLFAAILCAAPTPSALAQNGWTPAEPVRAEAAEAPPLAHQIGFFRRVLSRADGDRCSMHPSCSTYALESLKKHGALLGWIMTSDRLLRCGHDEVRLAPAVRGGDRRLAHDPVAANDFWWWSPPPSGGSPPSSGAPTASAP